jgi:hypothetical protein
MIPDVDHHDLFLPIIWIYIEQYKQARDKRIKTNIQQHNFDQAGLTETKIKEGLKDTLKKWTDIHVKMVSEGAIELASKTKANINLFELMWPDRKALNEDPKGKSLLVWEHTTTLEETFTDLIKCESQEEVKKFMSNYSGVCWITRDEDNRLNEKYKSKRPGGWRKCYQECGIIPHEKDQSR